MEQPKPSGPNWETHCYVTLFLQTPTETKGLVCVVTQDEAHAIGERLKAENDRQAAEVLRPTWEAFQAALANGRHTGFRRNRREAKEKG